MSQFFEQLIARQQGQVETVQPLVLSRFVQPVPSAENTLSEESGARQFVAETSEPLPPGHSRLSSPPVFGVASPSDPASSNPVTQGFTTGENVVARLESITRWIGEATGEVSQSKASWSDANRLAENPFQQIDNAVVTPFEPLTATSTALPVTSPAPDSKSLHLSAISAETMPVETAVPADESFPLPGTDRHQQTVSPLSLQPLLQPALPPSPLPAAPPPPTIQIAIGRVEIRATPANPTPSPRRAAPIKQPPMSLERYLQRRSREV